MKKIVGLLFIASCVAATSSYAQQAPRRGAGGGGQQQPTSREDALDPTPVDPKVDPNVDMWINDYRNSKPRTVYGNLVFHDILTRLDGADKLHPVKKGAVLSDIAVVSYATLAPGATASGKVSLGNVQIFLAVGGEGKITVNSKSYDLKDGIGFTLTPDFDFKLSSTGKVPLAFYVREEPMPSNFKATPDLVVVSRWDNDRRVGAHWVHTCNGGPNGLNLCTIPPHTMPQPHSHPQEEAWIMVKGETTLSLGKNLRRMTPGQAYRIPPTGVTAHSNINWSDEPVEMIYMGPLSRGGAGGGPQAGAQGAPQGGGAGGPQGGAAGGQQGTDFARLDNAAINPATEPDVDMYMGNWRDSFPRMMHGNLYVRDMLTALQGSDSMHPTHKGAVLTNATAVSYALLEPGSTAHPISGELKDVQEVFVVNSGTGVIKSGDKTFELSKGKAFIITPGLDFKMTGTGDHYMTFYVVTQKLPAGLTSKSTLEVVDNSAKPQVTKAWYDKERALITTADGLGDYHAITHVELPSMEMAQPYSDAQGVEEIWIATDGDVDMLFGKELRKLPAGTAYRVPSTGKTAHANINMSANPAQFLYMVSGNAEASAGH
jgi:mannose-6-phosphate isomerase-like protein (cupin superfamily)